MVAQVHAVARFSVEQALANVVTLEDAYQLVNEVEGAETNAIFNFVISTVKLDQSTRDFLRNQLQNHITRMHRLPPQYLSNMARQSISAQS